MTEPHIRFDPPAHPMPHSSATKAYADRLREQPGEWALLGHRETAGSARTYAWGIRRGVMSAFTPCGAYEAEMRTMFGEHRVYARFVGETSS